MPNTIARLAVVGMTTLLTFAAGAQTIGWNAIDAVLLFLSASLLAGTLCFFTLIRAAKPQGPYQV